jgi:hypothetical protein
LTIFLSLVLFSILYWNHSINVLMYSNFKELTFKNKVFFLWFTIFFAIPNRIIINNKVHNFLTGFVIFLILVLSNVFPVCIILYVIFWTSVIESYFFALFYLEKKSFKDFFDGRLFGENQTFSQDYFCFFWGDMASGSVRKGVTAAYATVGAWLFRLERVSECENVRFRTQVEMPKLVALAKNKPATAQEALEFQKTVENHIIDRDCPILSTEKAIKGVAKTVSDYFTGG